MAGGSEKNSYINIQLELTTGVIVIIRNGQQMVLYYFLPIENHVSLCSRGEHTTQADAEHARTRSVEMLKDYLSVSACHTDF